MRKCGGKHSSESLPHLFPPALPGHWLPDRSEMIKKHTHVMLDFTMNWYVKRFVGLSMYREQCQVG